jgi:hypothetical protein
MSQNPTSASGRPRPKAAPALVQPFPGSPPARVSATSLWAADRRLLSLLGEHQVLTTGQLTRLTDMPERTVQHRLGVLYRAGLISRHRPHAAVGTHPYHCWLTPFGAAAIGAAEPERWSEELAGLRTAAAVTDLWLGVRDHGAPVGLVLKGWRRLPAGVSYPDPQTGAARRLAADAELTVGLDTSHQEFGALVSARIDRVPKARLDAVFARFADYLTTSASANAHVTVLVLSRTTRHRAALLHAAEGLADAPASPNIDPAVLETTVRRVAVGVIEPRPAALAAEAVWRTAAVGVDRRLVDVLAEMAGSSR